jgi:hypothetical protein
MMLLPRAGRAFEGFQAFFFHELPMNGALLGDDIVIVREHPELNPVEGGTDEPTARVLGFTLGRTLGLKARREPETSLLAVGTTGIELDSADVTLARRVAKTVQGVMGADEIQNAATAAQAAGHADRAKRLRSWLAEIAAAEKDKAKSRRTASNSPASATTKAVCGPEGP